MNYNKFYSLTYYLIIILYVITCMYIYVYIFFNNLLGTIVKLLEFKMLCKYFFNPSNNYDN